MTERYESLSDILATAERIRAKRADEERKINEIVREFAELGITVTSEAGPVIVLPLQEALLTLAVIGNYRQRTAGN